MMTQPMGVLLERLAAGADHADRTTDWPLASWEALREAGVLALSTPAEFGGAGVGAIELHCVAEQIATACPTTAFILSQRETAVRQLIKGPPHLRERYLPRLASGDAFLTVGLSQLTTSRQHLGPALRAAPTDAGYVLDGEIPWVTGADQADAIVIGATLPDSQQLLLVMPTARPGVVIEAPLNLAALVGSRTALIRCNGVPIERDDILAGPSESVLGKVGGGGLETSCLAIGLTAAAVNYLRQEAIARPALADATERLNGALAKARDRLHALAIAPDPEATHALRADCTCLALKATQTALLAAKGLGFVTPHPAQRWARQALFFLVWSCPRSVTDGVLADLLTGVGGA